MRFQLGLLALYAAQGAAAASLIGGVLTGRELVESLIERPNILPESSRKVLAARAEELKQSLALSKRSPQTPQGAAGAPPNQVMSENDAWYLLLSGIAGMTTQTAPGHVKPKSTVPEVSDGPSDYRSEYPGAKKRKIRYGPYRVPSTTEKNIESLILGQQGLTSGAKLFAKKPCDGKCLILKMSAGMEYANGSHADIDNGAWLHHCVMVNVGSQIKDPVCSTKYMENMFMSAKTETEGMFLLPNSTVKSGYHLNPTDTFVLFTELMNLNVEEKWVWLTINYDFLEGENPEHKDARVVWMTISRSLCGNSTDNPFGEGNLTVESRQPLKRVFSEHSIPWEVPADALLLGENGHLHDGGISMDIFLDSKKICTTSPKYGRGPAPSMSGAGGLGTGGPPKHTHGKREDKPLPGGTYNNTDIDHIIQQYPCIHEPPLVVKKGEPMWLAANYDFQTHPGMKNDKGELDEVMGIAGMTFAFPYPRV